MLQYKEAARSVEERLRKQLLVLEAAKIREEEIQATLSPDPQTERTICDDTATSETLATDIEPNAVVEEHSPVQATDIPDESDAPKLIRSNSYTLDSPSPMLLRFLNGSSKAPVSAATTPNSSTVPIRDKKGRSQSEPSKLRKIYALKTPARKAKSETLNDTKRRLKIHSKGEIVERYGLKSKTRKDFENLKGKPSRPKPSIAESVSEKPVESVHSPAQTSPIETLSVKALLKSIEEQHKKQQEELVRRQAEEQKQLMDQFARQQQNLIAKLKQSFPELISNESRFMQNRTSSPIQSDHQLNGSLNAEESSFYSTVRGDSPTCSMSLVSDAYSKQYLSSIRSFNEEPLCRKENAAATKINSLVRGYLIRRLLRTAFVQNVIENIKNILCTILDSDPKTGDIKLRRNYLLILNSNCEKLHDVFFKLSIKERMELIAKDREMLSLRLRI